MRISWVHPDVAARARTALLEGRASWEDVFAGDRLIAREPPGGVNAASWPQLAEHVARAERVREVIATSGLEAAGARFGASAHAIERAALAEALEQSPSQAPTEILAAAHGVLACPIDEHLAYGHFLSQIVGLGAASDPAGTVAALERFVAAAAAHRPTESSWAERLSVARDALAALYARVGRSDDAESVFVARFDADPADTAVAIGAARVFLEVGSVARAVAWLERGAARARTAGRVDLAARLGEKLVALRARLS
jgi:predicted Zn-dependent protease